MSKTASPSARLLKTFSLAAVIFLTVSGGPYGLEPLTQYAGKNGALLLLLLVPLLWDLPSILMVLELNSLMPVNGGYYKWVNRALGRRWAFFESWWSWLYSFTDLAIYPVLFVTYLGYFFPAIQEWKVPIMLVIIWGSAGLNILGIVHVGRVSLILGAIIIIPFLGLFGTAFFSSSIHFTMPSPSLNGIGFSAIGMALYTVMWNFLGWDNTTTYAEEVDKPARSYLVSIGIAFSIVFIIYFVAIIESQYSGINYATLRDQGYPALGVVLGGHWLGVIVAVGGMASALGLFSAVLLSVSRVPKVMADDKLLSPKLSALHPKFNTPYISIIICAAVVSVMILWSFTDLLIIDVTLYGAALSLEFISLIILRIKAPDEHRPFKIPLNVVGLCLMALLPLCVYSVALVAAFSTSGASFKPALFAVGTLLSAEVVWRIIVWRNPAINSR